MDYDNKLKVPVGGANSPVVVYMYTNLAAQMEALNGLEFVSLHSAFRRRDKFAKFHDPAVMGYAELVLYTLRTVITRVIKLSYL